MDESKNPFPSSAIANLPSRAEAARKHLSIETTTLMKARQTIDEVVAARALSVDAVAPSGAVLCLVGEPGTGKTHALRELSDYVSSHFNTVPLVIEQGRADYLAVFSDAIFVIYNKTEIIKLIDIAMANFFQETTPEKIYIIQLLAERDGKFFDLRQFLLENRLDVDDIVDRFFEELLDSGAKPQLLKELKHIYTSPTDDNPWERFRISVEAPVNGSIKTLEEGSDDQLVKLFDLLALLEFRAGRLMLLIIDEAEKFFHNNQSDQKNAFLKRIFETLLARGQLCLLAGLPEFKEALSAETSQRITASVTVTPWAEDDVRRYIEAAKGEQPAGLSREFTADAIRGVMSVSAGNARLTLRLLHQVYSSALLAENSSSVSLENVREATRGIFEGVSLEAIGRKITEIIGRNGGVTEQEWVLPNLSKRLRIDYLGMVAERPTLFILITNSILKKREKENLIARIRACVEYSDDGDKRILVIANGYLAPDYRADARSAGANRVLLIKPDTFEDDIAEAIDELLRSVPQRLRLADEDIGRLTGLVVDRLETYMRRQERRNLFSTREIQRFSQAVSARLSASGSASSQSYLRRAMEHSRRRSFAELESILTASKYVVWAYRSILDATLDGVDEFGVSRRTAEMRMNLQSMITSQRPDSNLGIILAVDATLDIFAGKIDNLWAVPSDSHQSSRSRASVTINQFDNTIGPLLHEYLSSADQILLISQRYMSLEVFDAEDSLFSDIDGFIPRDIIDRLKRIEYLGRMLLEDFEFRNRSSSY